MTKTAASPGVTHATTPWGRATIVERVELPQRAGERRFASLLELLEDERGTLLVRLSYSTGGAVRRGPVTLRARDLERLREQLGKASRLAEALRGT